MTNRWFYIWSRVVPENPTKLWFQKTAVEESGAHVCSPSPNPSSVTNWMAFADDVTALSAFLGFETAARWVFRHWMLRSRGERLGDFPTCLKAAHPGPPLPSLL